MGSTEDVKSGRKYFHEQYKCQVPPTEKFCSEYCPDSGEVEETELQCDCEHPACALD